MAGTSKFWDRAAANYARQPIGDEAAYQRKLQKTREYLTPGMNLLEFGCGTGSTAIAHAPHVKSIHAIDVSGKMLEFGREKAKAAGVTNVTFEQLAIEDLPADGQRYDAILGLSVLHLLPDWDATIRKVFELLAPGGIFVSSTACIGDHSPLLRLVLPLATKLGAAPFVATFKAEQLVQSIKAAGFVIEHQWQPGPGKALFVIARKPADQPSQ